MCHMSIYASFKKYPVSEYEIKNVWGHSKKKNLKNYIAIKILFAIRCTYLII